MRPLTIKQALAQMGDLRGTYFPRIRETGAYVLITKKDGMNPIRKHFDIPTVGDDKPNIQKGLAMTTPAGREEKRLKELGYDVTIKKDDSPAEDVFEATNLIDSLDAILQDSMQVIDKNNDTQVRSGQHINQILTLQIADIFKQRGYLSIRLRRLDGDDIWEGYEEDMSKALIQNAKNVAAGTAKRDTSRVMILAFTGRDYSWSDYKREVEDPDWNEYIEIVEKRRIDPRTQKNLYRDVRPSSGLHGGRAAQCRAGRPHPRHNQGCCRSEVSWLPGKLRIHQRHEHDPARTGDTGSAYRQAAVRGSWSGDQLGYCLWTIPGIQERERR